MSHTVSDEIAIIRRELDLIERGEDQQVAAATIRQAAYTIARLVSGLDRCARLTHSSGRLHPEYEGYRS